MKNLSTNMNIALSTLFFLLGLMSILAIQSYNFSNRLSENRGQNVLTIANAVFDVIDGRERQFVPNLDVAPGDPVKSVQEQALIAVKAMAFTDSATFWINIVDLNSNELVFSNPKKFILNSTDGNEIVQNILISSKGIDGWHDISDEESSFKNKTISYSLTYHPWNWLIHVSAREPASLTYWGFLESSVSSIFVLILMFLFAPSLLFAWRAKQDFAKRGIDDETGLQIRAALVDRLEKIDQGVLADDAGWKNSSVITLKVPRYNWLSDHLQSAQLGELMNRYLRRIETVLSGKYLIARTNVDRFAIILQETANETSAMRVVAMLKSTLFDPFELTIGMHRIGVHIGFAGQNSSDSLVNRLRNSEVSLHQIDPESRLSFSDYCSHVHNKTTQRMALAFDLVGAIRKDQFNLVYQPKLHSRSGQIVGYEALIRWSHPERGSISPDVFIPLAEEIGFIGDLTLWVFKEALFQQQCWRAKGFTLHPVAVNVSPVDFCETVAPALEKMIDNLELEASLIELELTETAVLTDSKQVRETLLGLRAKGLSVAIDDFGTGYSSFKYLNDIPASCLKIDREYICTLIENPGQQAVVKSIIAMAKALDLSVIAEGVETIEQVELLKSYGVDQFQGFYFHRPKNPDDLEGDLKKITPFKEAS